MRHLPLASRWRDSGTIAGARGRNPDAAWRRYRHAARRMRQAAGAACGPRTRDAAVAAVGGALRLAFLAQGRPGYALFGIVQGGDDPTLRATSVRELVGIGFEGYAIGGLAVGESPDVMRAMIDDVAPALPARSSALPDGRGNARGHSRSDCSWHRHVRLRAADPQRPPRGSVHAIRRAQSQERAPCRRPAAARRNQSLSGGPYLLARLFAPLAKSGEMLGAVLLSRHQPCLLPAADRRCAAGNRRATVPGISPWQRPKGGHVATLPPR